MRILIKNGIIIDGTGQPGFPGMLAVEGELIRTVGVTADSLSFDQVIDAEGMVVAPGFIDTHSHSDVNVLLNPFVEAKFGKASQPKFLDRTEFQRRRCPEPFISAWRKILAGFDGDSDGY